MTLSSENSTTTTARQVRLAARALARAGLAHAYGHVSARLDGQTFLVGPPTPMGLFEAGAPCTVVPIEGPLPDGVLGEVRVHQRIYARRPDVNGICRTQPTDVLTLSVMRRVPRARHGFGCYFSPHVAFWDDIQLLRDDASADALAATLGSDPAVVMRGNGAVVVGETLRRAVVLSWYLEDSARVELELIRAGLAHSAPTIPDEDARRRAVWTGGLEDRMWAYLTHGDPELA